MPILSWPIKTRSCVPYTRCFFLGSALRKGGGYAQAELCVLETPKLEEEDDGTQDGEDREGAPGLGLGLGVREPSSMGGLVGTLEAATGGGTRKKSFNKFQK